MEWTLTEVCAAVGGVATPGQERVRIEGVTSDSRGEVRGCLFVALRGARFDGHDFVATALRKGAAGALVEEERWKNHPDREEVPSERVVRVADSLEALGRLGEAWRLRWRGRVVAVTGSAGKTTVKELLSAALAAELGAEQVWATPGNWNNAVGVPLTLCGLRERHRAAVVEVAMNQRGEIAYLGQLVRPNMAVVTNALRAHLAGVGSLSQVAVEKGSLLRSLPRDGVGVANADSPFWGLWREMAGERTLVGFGEGERAAVRVERVNAEGAGVQVSVRGLGQEVEVELPLLGRHQAWNAAAALAALAVLGVSWKQAAAAWRRLHLPAGRLQVLPSQGGGVVVDDSYNANPDAAKAAIDALMGLPQRYKVVVLGEMAELGEEGAALTAEVGEYARSRGVNALLALGDAAPAAAAFGVGGMAFAEEALEELVEQAKRWDGEETAFLVKGSRVSRMERVVRALRASEEGVGGVA
ncbi:MAG: UDP-N-acetylmuramoyl-tripeptide--D-alanyl-D-alanine ligase [Hydrogenophilus sp.]|nr:UDP-N-acetylmuramoyl-tripeptide--D-alanyl-D-alanine ligase [Hydrogenophilus sp.]